MLYSLHVGDIAPAGQWDRENTAVTRAVAGRPRRLVDVREHAQELLDRYGSVRAVARATGLHRATVEASLHREVSPTVAKSYVVHLSLPIRERREAEEVPSYADLTVPATKPLDITTESLGASNPTPPRTQATPLVSMEAPAPTGYRLAPWERQCEPLGAPTVDESADDGSTPAPGASIDPGASQVPSLSIGRFCPIKAKALGDRVRARRLDGDRDTDPHRWARARALLDRFRAKRARTNAVTD